MALTGRLEAIIYAAEEPVTVEQLTLLLKDSIVAEDGLGEMDAAAIPGEVKARVRAALDELIAAYADGDHGIEIRQVAGGYRMATKPEHHDVVRSFAKSLKPPMRLSLQALETLSVIAYKQPVTAPEISEIRGVDSSGVLATLMDRKLITTAGRKQVVGRPILYRTTKEFLMRFGLKDLGELPSMEEFEKLISGAAQEDLFVSPQPGAAPPVSEGSDSSETHSTESDPSAAQASEQAVADAAVQPNSES